MSWGLLLCHDGAISGHDFMRRWPIFSILVIGLFALPRRVLRSCNIINLHKLQRWKFSGLNGGKFMLAMSCREFSVQIWISKMLSMPLGIVLQYERVGRRIRSVLSRELCQLFICELFDMPGR